MKRIPIPTTLRIRRPIGRTLAWSCLWLILLAVLAEVCCRTSRLRPYLPEPSVGSGHDQLDVKLNLLDAYVREHQGIDCIFMGSSMVHRGFDPAAFEEGFRQRTGQSLRCFNFGLRGVADSCTAPLAQILCDTYHPRMVIFGISPGLLDPRAGVNAERSLLSNPWFQYHSGVFSVDGWLIDHSTAFRMFLGWRRRHAVRDALPGTRKPREPRIEPNGFGYKGRAQDSRLSDLTLARRDRVLKKYFKLSGFQVSDAHLVSLGQVVALRDRTRVILVEMPIQELLINFSVFGRDKYYGALAQMEQVARRHGLTILRTTPFTSIGEEGWFDFHHLNHVGARLFSLWLGQRIGSMQAGRDPAPGLPHKEPAFVPATGTSASPDAAGLAPIR
jgi:hypothetical protein